MFDINLFPGNGNQVNSGLNLNTPKKKRTHGHENEALAITKKTLSAKALAILLIIFRNTLIVLAVKSIVSIIINY